MGLRQKRAKKALKILGEEMLNYGPPAPEAPSPPESPESEEEKKRAAFERAAAPALEALHDIFGEDYTSLIADLSKTAGDIASLEQQRQFPVYGPPLPECEEEKKRRAFEQAAAPSMAALQDIFGEEFLPAEFAGAEDAIPVYGPPLPAEFAAREAAARAASEKAHAEVLSRPASEFSSSKEIADILARPSQDAARRAAAQRAAQEQAARQMMSRGWPTWQIALVGIGILAMVGGGTYLLLSKRR